MAYVLFHSWVINLIDFFFKVTKNDQTLQEQKTRENERPHRFFLKADFFLENPFEACSGCRRNIPTTLQNLLLRIRLMITDNVERHPRPNFFTDSVLLSKDCNSNMIAFRESHDP